MRKTFEPTQLGWDDAAAGRVARKPVGFLSDPITYTTYLWAHYEWYVASGLYATNPLGPTR